MSQKKFTVKNEGFVCLVCGVNVSPHLTSSRDHCSKCLYSLHLDVNPGDRANACGGVLKPVGLEMKNSKQRIVYKCQSCGERVFNIVASDDNNNALVSLSSKVW